MLLVNILHGRCSRPLPCVHKKSSLELQDGSSPKQSPSTLQRILKPFSLYAFYSLTQHMHTLSHTEHTHTLPSSAHACGWKEKESRGAKRKRERKREALTLSPRLVESETSEFFFLPLSIVFDSVALAASVCPPAHSLPLCSGGQLLAELQLYVSGWVRLVSCAPQGSAPTTTAARSGQGPRGPLFITNRGLAPLLLLLLFLFFFLIFHHHHHYRHHQHQHTAHPLHPRHCTPLSLGPWSPPVCGLGHPHCAQKGWTWKWKRPPRARSPPPRLR